MQQQGKNKTATSHALMTSIPSYQVPTSGFNLSKIRCRLHPSVLMTMLQAHDRLSEVNGLAIGTLLGTVSADGTKGTGNVVVEIVDCFANPFHWDITTTALTIQKEPHEWMLKLRQRVNPKLSVVGWCCTTDKILYTIALNEWVQTEHKISRFKATKNLPDPIHLLIDPSFSRDSNILNATKAYVRGPLKQLFHTAQLEIYMHPADLPATSAIIKASSYVGDENESDSTSEFCLDDKSRLAISLRKLSEDISYCLKYIQAVLNDETKGDVNVGRQLMKALCYEPLLPKQEVESLLKGTIEDNLMVAYVINLARLQFAAAERLNMSFA